MTIRTLPLHANGHRVTGRLGDNTVKVVDSGDGIPVMVSHLFECAGCGEYFSPQITDDGAHIDTPCACADGITTVVTLNVPSGKIVVTDDLRPVYNGFDHDRFASYNSALGVSQVIKAFAEQGCAFGHVGNSCPSLYKTGEDAYVIASGLYDDEEDGYPKVTGWDRLAGICTDLWAYSVADFEAWKARGGDPEKLDWMAEVVEIPAGTYEFTYHGGEKGFDRDSADTVIFTHIKKVV